VRTNATPASINDLNMMPVKFANGATIFLKDVAQVRDGFAGAAEHRARGWPPLGSAQRDQERQCLDAGGRQRREEGAAGDPRRSTSRTQDQRTVRPVGIRHQLGHRRAA